MKKQFINEVSRMKNLFDYKRGVVISVQKFLNEAEIPYPTDLPKDAYDAIMKFSEDNKKANVGSYLVSTQAAEIDKKYGAGTFKKFTDAGGYDVLMRTSTFTGIPAPAAVAIKGSTKEEYPECVKVFGNPVASPSGKQYSIIGTGDWANYYFYPNGGYGDFTITGTKPPHGKYSCNGNTIKIEPSVQPPAAATKQATQWTAEPATLDDDKNTLKKQMTGEKVKQLQTGLDIKGRGGKSLATGKFWTLTDAKLKELYPTEYTTQKGVTKTLFDKIVNPTLKASTAAAPTTIPAAGVTPAGTTPAAPAAGTPPATVTAPQMPAVAAKQTPEEIYNTLKSGSLVQGDLGNNNIRIDAKAVNDEQRKKLQEYMTSNGYEYRRTKNRDGRLVYTKR